MAVANPKPHVSRKRCAIYTRRSRESPLEQNFTSLDSQRAMCSAYIDSQQHKGWLKVPKEYEDPAQSGATLDRPAMLELLADVERGLVDVVVVYKLDRLSRSLLDFVRLLDLFERYGVTFVCITQNFDTADSLGRLVMNVLLTFAQFEREMAGDRIRDKQRAMSMNGLWRGGHPPIGYDLVRGKLVENEPEAAIVRSVYEKFLALKSYQGVARECASAGMMTKTWVTRHGRVVEGVLMKTSSVRKILHNPAYAGYVRSNDETFEGIHNAIVSRGVWEQVAIIREKKLIEQRSSAPVQLFDGLLFDCFGRRMKLDRQLGRGRWCCFYRSNQSERDHLKHVKRLRANFPEADDLIISAIRGLLSNVQRVRAILLDLGRWQIDAPAAKGHIISRRFSAFSFEQLRSVLRGLIVRVEISRERMKIVIRSLELERLLEWDGIGLFRGAVGGRAQQTCLLDLPCAGAIRLERYLRLPISPQSVTAPAKANTPAKANRGLVGLIREARTAQALVDDRRERTPAELASSMKRHIGFFMKLLRLNYLAPDIVAAIHDGNHPPGLTRKALINTNLPLDWELQRELLGFPAQAPIRTCDAHY
jgi:site-specific DNA recombinase